MARLNAGVRKRADGLFEKRFTVKGKRYSVYGKNNKEVLEKELEIRTLIEQNAYTTRRNLTLNAYYSEWIEEKAKHNKENSIRNYAIAYKSNIKDILGSRKLAEIERRECIALQNKLSQTRGTAATNYAMLVLRMIFNSAIADEIISKNPAKSIKPLKTEKAAATETNHRAFTEEEQALIMAELKNSFYYEVMALMLASGMRQGEVGALTWQDIDYINNVIHINKTLTRNVKGETTIGKPKSKAGVRDIPINDTIKAILKSQKDKTEMIYGNVIPIDNKVFFNSLGGYVDLKICNRAITETIRALNEKGHNIEHFTTHAFRDTFATRYIEQGGNPQTLKTILGHSSLAMTMDLYAHVLPNTKQEEMNNIKISI